MTGALVRHKRMKMSRLCVAALAVAHARARPPACSHVADFIKFFIGRQEETPS
jgi:hypothetical protein